VSNPTVTRGVYTEAEARERAWNSFGTLKGVDRANRTAEFVVSTIKVDRDGDIVLPSAVGEAAEKFLATNAPLAAQHMHRSDTGTPTQIGWWLSLAASGKAVTGRCRFAATETAEQWWLLASDEGGKGVACSIGFIPRGWVRGTAAEMIAAHPEIRQSAREAGLKDDDALLVYTALELVEISLCLAPSNRESLQVLAAKAAAEGEDKALDALATRIAGKLVGAGGSASRDAGGDVKAVCAAVESAVKAAVAEAQRSQQAWLLEQLDEIRAMLPDNVHPLDAGDGHDPDDDDQVHGGGDVPDVATEELPLTGRAAAGLLDSLAD
jgi:hypothetical protein